MAPDKAGRGRAISHLSPYSYLSSYTSTALGNSPIDPRTSSTASIVPEADLVASKKRTLLVIYIHGFVGDETSFRSFPAHLHHVLALTIETHAIYTKIYPRFKTRYAIDVATEEFSKWLQKFESPTTDVILIGHSMGGLLAAEVAMLLPYNQSGPVLHPATTNLGEGGRHRLLGILCFDTPFLGMHPGVIMAGLGSLFRPAPVFPTDGTVTDRERVQKDFGPQDQGLPLPLSKTSTISSGGGPASPLGSAATSLDNFSQLSLTSSGPLQSTSSLATTQSAGSQAHNRPESPNKEKKPWIAPSTLHFIVKHYSDLPHASVSYVRSHLEFGGCMLDIVGLKQRYDVIKTLDSKGAEVSMPVPGLEAEGVTRKVRAQVRFVNYYTSSSGRPKRHKSKEKTQPLPVSELIVESRSASEAGSSRQSLDAPSISVQSTDDDVTPGQVQVKSDVAPVQAQAKSSNSSTVLPEDPDCELPNGPKKPDASGFNQASDHSWGEYQRQMGEYRRVRAEHIRMNPHLANYKPPPQTSEVDSALPPIAESKAEGHKDLTEKEAEKEAKRLKKEEEKERKRVEKEAKAKAKAEAKAEAKKEKEEAKRQKEAAKIGSAFAAPSTTTPEKAAPLERPVSPGPPLKFNRKFCVLPKNDPNWVQVRMQGVDEVGAHCGLFFMGEVYQGLVADVGARIEDWVREAEDQRMAWGLQWS